MQPISRWRFLTRDCLCRTARDCLASAGSVTSARPKAGDNQARPSPHRRTAESDLSHLDESSPPSSRREKLISRQKQLEEAARVFGKERPRGSLDFLIIWQVKGYKFGCKYVTIFHGHNWVRLRLLCNKGK